MPGIRWKEAKGIREMLAHDYGQTDVEILADVVDNNLPKLIEEIEAALAAD